MKIRIRDWEENFEQDRSKQWKHLKWVPIPNKQGVGYKKIMAEKNGLEIFACWIALVQSASRCNPRGDLSKYTLHDLALDTMISDKILEDAILYLSQVLDWVEVIENLDKNVNNLDISRPVKDVGSSILCNSVLCNSKEGESGGKNTIPPTLEMVTIYCKERNMGIDPQSFLDHYEARGWQFKTGQKMKDWQAAVRTWEKNGFNKTPLPQKPKLQC